MDDSSPIEGGGGSTFFVEIYFLFFLESIRAFFLTSERYLSLVNEFRVDAMLKGGEGNQRGPIP